VAHLAACTGHRFVRINNHEQTDLQEYLGSYVADEQVGLRLGARPVPYPNLRLGSYVADKQVGLRRAPRRAAALRAAAQAPARHAWRGAQALWSG